MPSKPSKPTAAPRASSKTPARTTAKARSTTPARAPKPDLTKSRFPQTVAKDYFITLCKHVAENKTKIFIKDKHGQYFMTISPRERHDDSPVLDISAQFFKTNFGPMVNIIKMGRQFRVKTRDSNRAVYVRRNTNYKDPLDHLNEQWIEMLTDTITQQVAEEFNRAEHKATQSRVDEMAETVERIRKLTGHIARVAIGHRHDQEGQLPNGSPFDKDEPE